MVAVTSVANLTTEIKRQMEGQKNTPARIAQLVRALEVVGSIPGLVNLTTINCLSDETLNRGPV